uniref:Secreted protein n=1 Tax=Lactuca sativa TaxID=4236 RepID=A0A9R1WRK8_LACSA|nr:hypothetical protein LSAT_V11C900478040 [Lactuca sativa]
MLTTTIVTPLVVIEPVSGAPVVPASNTIVVEALISSADYIALDTPSEATPFTLVSLVSSLPSFLHPYTSTNFTNKPALGKITDE